MKSTKVQNPRWVYKPIMRVYWPHIAVQLYFPGQYLLLRRLAASCIVWGKAESASRPSRTILRDALSGQKCYSGVRGFCTVRIMTAGGCVTKLYACALFIIDGLGHATCSRRCRFLDPERRIFSENATIFSSACCARAVGIAHEPVWCLYCWNKWRQTHTHTDRQTHRPSTVTLAAHAHRGLIKLHTSWALLRRSCFWTDFTQTSSHISFISPRSCWVTVGSSNTSATRWFPLAVAASTLLW